MGLAVRPTVEAYLIGYCHIDHIDRAKGRTQEGTLYLFVAIDHTATFAFARLEDTANSVDVRGLVQFRLTPYAFIRKIGTSEPARCKLDPTHHTIRRNS